MNDCFITVSLTCQSGNTMFVKWVRPSIFFRTVDVYYVMYRGRVHEGAPGGVVQQQAGKEEEQWEEQIVETVNNTINHMVRETYSVSEDFQRGGASLNLGK